MRSVMMAARFCDAPVTSATSSGAKGNERWLGGAGDVVLTIRPPGLCRPPDRPRLQPFCRATGDPGKLVDKSTARSATANLLAGGELSEVNRLLGSELRARGGEDFPARPSPATRVEEVHPDPPPFYRTGTWGAGFVSLRIYLPTCR
jgi:hypothetical protein